MTEVIDRSFEAFKRLVPHLRGSLWWGANDLVKEREPTFNQMDAHRSHPLLSLRKEELTRRADAVPMLMGTSGTRMYPNEKRRCIEVKGLSRRVQDHVTYFGSIIEPALYSVADMIDGVSVKRGERTIEEIKDAPHDGIARGRCRFEHWTEHHRMVPNWDKPVVDKTEMAMVDDYCLIHQL